MDLEYTCSGKHFTIFEFGLSSAVGASYTACSESVLSQWGFFVTLIPCIVGLHLLGSWIHYRFLGGQRFSCHFSVCPSVCTFCSWLHSYARLPEQILTHLSQGLHVRGLSCNQLRLGPESHSFAWRSTMSESQKMETGSDSCKQMEEGKGRLYARCGKMEADFALEVRIDRKQ